MFEIDARGGLGRSGTWTRGERALRTPLVLFASSEGQTPPEYAEALFVSERTADPRLQVRTSGSFFAPREASHADDLPPTKGTPISLADLEIPQARSVSLSSAASHRRGTLREAQRNCRL